MRDRSLLDSVNSAVEAAGDSITEKDQALVNLARKYAARIDEALLDGGQDATKALYLGPHLTNALIELGLTPGGAAKAKASAGEVKQEAMSKPADELSALRTRHRGGA